MKKNVKSIFKKIKGREARKEREEKEDFSSSIKMQEHPMEEKNKTELEKVVEFFKDKERDAVWAFMAGKYRGQHSQDFRGNLKSLFDFLVFEGI